MKTADWTETALWERLTGLGSSADSTRHYVRSWLEDVQTLLAKAGTSPLNFTLHDDGHSYRVAQRMVDLVPDETLNRLCDYELALLLLSAYLHDIGMNPNYEIVLRVRAFLLTGSSNLPAAEADCLQKWLDDTNSGMQPPLLQALPDDERLEKIELLTAYYCRFRHNDWSEEFISEKAKIVGHAPYGLFVQDLILLCKSHHFGMQELMSPSFDLRIVGGDNRLVNLRYLAAVFRVADVLEFDPERTPEVIFAHRGIPISSKIFWYKDHAIVLGISKKNFSVLITARTSDAWTHRAVLDTANDVDAEFQTCANIKDQGGFSRGVKLDSADYYIWKWPPRSAHDINPVPGTFEYIDGAFRPDNRRILALLAGTQLYETPLAAVRELLQNAFDAVKEQIALELLNDPNAHKPEVQDARSKLHRVTLVVETRQNPKTNKAETWLTCTDTGVGMTRRVIERHLLVGGSRPRPELLRLERLCKAEGINLNRSGEFGVGVLSYFMLADKLILETKSSAEAYIDHEAQGWRFETEGLDAFGELRRVPGLIRGSAVHLRISVSNQEFISATRIERFLDAMLARLPCELLVRVDTWSRRWEPPWAKVIDEFKDRTFPVGSESEALLIERYRSALKSRRAKERDDLEDHLRRKVRDDGKMKLRFYGPMEGEIADAGGTYRIHLPFFELDDGVSLAFLSLDLLAHPVFWDVQELVRVSWRGFTVGSEADFGSPDERILSLKTPVACVIEVDLWRNAQIAVNRKGLKIFNKDDIEALIEEKIDVLLDQFSESYRSKAKYCALTPAWARLISCSEPANYKGYWIFKDSVDDGSKWVWRESRFPAISVSAPPSQEIRAENGSKDILTPTEVRFGYYGHRSVVPFAYLSASRLIVAGRNIGSCDAYVLYEDANHEAVENELIVEFPPEWKDWVAIDPARRQSILNRDHPAVLMTTPQLRASMAKTVRSIGNKKLLEDKIIRAGPESAAWILHNVHLDWHDWEALLDNFGDYLLSIFDSAGLFLTHSGSSVILKLDQPKFILRAVKEKVGLLAVAELRKLPDLIKFPADPKYLL